MLVVLTSVRDPAATTLLDAWPGDARRLCAEDLSYPGWVYEPGGTAGWAVLGGERVAADRIDAVVTQLPWVVPDELGAIAPADREYVAAEMTAFLAAWLSGLACPVLNRPLPGQLMGPGWSAARWAQVACAAGITTRLEPIRIAPVSEWKLDGQRAPGDDSDNDTVGFDRRQTVTVIGGRALGAAEPGCANAAETLAAAAGVALLRAHFAEDQDEFVFIDADYWVDIADPAVIAATVDHLEELAR
jgi:hypothetical protein